MYVSDFLAKIKLYVCASCDNSKLYEDFSKKTLNNNVHQYVCCCHNNISEIVHQSLVLVERLEQDKLILYRRAFTYVS